FVFLASLLLAVSAAEVLQHLIRSNATPIISVCFQAEDGIRDRNVTGVQTCALPILDLLENPVAERVGHWIFQKIHACVDGTLLRSEERRVGKECRARGCTGDCKKRSKSTRCGYTHTTQQKSTNDRQSS